MAATATATIAAAIQSIPEKKEKLRAALEALQAHSSAMASFILRWDDLEEHYAALDAAINNRFKALLAKEEESELEGRLPSICARMDASALRAYVVQHRKDLNAVKEELTSALRSAPDPAELVLQAVQERHVSEDTPAYMRTCTLLLDRLLAITPFIIQDDVRDKARQLSFQWKPTNTSSYSGENLAIEALAFLQLVTTFKLMTEFSVDEVIDVIILVPRRKQTIDLCKMLELPENSICDLIQKLCDKGKQLDAVKYVCAFSLLEKFPPVPLLKDYVKEIEKVAQEIQQKGNNSLQSKNDAIAKEIGALKSVIKIVEENKLESEYPTDSLEKRIAELEQQQQANKKRNASAASSNSKSKQQKHQESNKRSRSLRNASTSLAARHKQRESNKRSRPFKNASTRFASQTARPIAQAQAQLLFSDHAPHVRMAGSYGLTTSDPLYGRNGHNLPAASLSLGASPSISHLYQPELHTGSALYHQPEHHPASTLYYQPEHGAGSASYPSEHGAGSASYQPEHGVGSGFYQKPVSYNYPLSDVSSSYNTSLYP